MFYSILGGKMKVSIITPNYNGLKFLDNYLNSLLNEQSYINEIIIIDNGSVDGSIEFLEEKSKISNYPVPIKLIKNNENLGFAKAINQGIKIANSEYLFLLNNDVELASGAIYHLINSMDESIANLEKPFSISSKMLRYYERDIIDDAGDEYNLLGWTKKSGDGQLSNNYSQKKEIFSSCAGAALYRKSIIEKIGYFDENFFAYMEDVDLSCRAQIYGYHNFFEPLAIVYHIGSGTSGSKYNEFKVKLAARNNIWTIYKNIPIPFKILNFIFLFFGFLIKYIFFVNKGFGLIYLNGLKEGLANRNKITKVKFKWTNWKNYLSMEWKLIKNTILFLNK